MTVSLPIPGIQSFVQKFYWIGKNKTYKCNVVISKKESISEIRFRISKILDMSDPRAFIMGFISDDKFDKLLLDSEPSSILEQFKNSTLFIFEVSPDCLIPLGTSTPTTPGP
jgi:hypothetical protein